MKADKAKTYLVRVSELEEDKRGIAVLGRVLTFEEARKEQGPAAIGSTLIFEKAMRGLANKK